MKREELLSSVGDQPFFTTGMLLEPGIDVRDIHRQLSRWTGDGTVLQLRRGLYVLGRQYRRQNPDALEISNVLVPGSYVSMESAQSLYHLIPDTVQATTAVTTGRSGVRTNGLGVFAYQHVKPDLLWGYVPRALMHHRTALVATPEKSLLDTAYFTVDSDDPAYVRELRLQNLEVIDEDVLLEAAGRFGVRRVLRFARIVADLAREEREEYGIQ